MVLGAYFFVINVGKESLRELFLPHEDVGRSAEAILPDRGEGFD